MFQQGHHNLILVAQCPRVFTSTHLTLWMLRQQVSPEEEIPPLGGPLLCFEDATDRREQREWIRWGRVRRAVPHMISQHLPVISSTPSWLAVDRCIITMLVRRRHRPASSRSGADVWHLGTFRAGPSDASALVARLCRLCKPLQTGGSMDTMP